MTMCYPLTKFACLAHPHTEKPTGPVSIENGLKPVQSRCSESPLVEREHTKSPDTQIYGQQQLNLALANGLTSVHGAKTGSAGSVTTNLICDVKACDAELERCMTVRLG